MISIVALSLAYLACCSAFTPSFSMLPLRKSVCSINSPLTRRNLYFDFQDDPINIDQSLYDDLLEWAFEDTSVKPPLKIRPSEVGHGKGLFATKDIKKDSVIFRMKDSKCLTLENSRNHSTLGEKLDLMATELGEQEGSIAALAAYLASEMLREQCAEWEEDESLKGNYSQYMAILPSGRGVSEQDHVLWWSDAEVKRVFKKGAVLEKAEALRDWVHDEGGIIMGMLVTDLAEKNMGLSMNQVRGAVTNAFVNVLTRSFFVGEGGKQRLVPIADMTQHSNDPNLEIVLESGGQVVVFAKKDILAGEEMTSDYYSSEFEGHEFYVMYGFVTKLTSKAMNQS